MWFMYTVRKILWAKCKYTVRNRVRKDGQKDCNNDDKEKSSKFLNKNKINNLQKNKNREITTES